MDNSLQTFYLTIAILLLATAIFVYPSLKARYEKKSKKGKR